MATTDANTKSRNKVNAPVIKIVNVLPDIGRVDNGEMYLLISDSHADDKKIHIRTASGWLKTSALS